MSTTASRLYTSRNTQSKWANYNIDLFVTLYIPNILQLHYSSVAANLVQSTSVVPSMAVWPDCIPPVHNARASMHTV